MEASRLRPVQCALYYIQSSCQHNVSKRHTRGPSNMRFLTLKVAIDTMTRNVTPVRLVLRRMRLQSHPVSGETKYPGSQMPDTFGQEMSSAPAEVLVPGMQPKKHESFLKRNERTALN